MQHVQQPDPVTRKPKMRVSHVLIYGAAFLVLAVSAPVRAERSLPSPEERSLATLRETATVDPPQFGIDDLIGGVGWGVLRSASALEAFLAYHATSYLSFELGTAGSSPSTRWSPGWTARASVRLRSAYGKVALLDTWLFRFRLVLDVGAAVRGEALDPAIEAGPTAGLELVGRFHDVYLRVTPLRVDGGGLGGGVVAGWLFGAPELPTRLSEPVSGRAFRRTRRFCFATQVTSEVGAGARLATALNEAVMLEVEGGADASSGFEALAGPTLVWGYGKWALALLPYPLRLSLTSGVKAGARGPVGSVWPMAAAAAGIALHFGDFELRLEVEQVVAREARSGLATHGRFKGGLGVWL